MAYAPSKVVIQNSKITLVAENITLDKEGTFHIGTVSIEGHADNLEKAVTELLTVLTQGLSTDELRDKNKKKLIEIIEKM